MDYSDEGSSLGAGRFGRWIGGRKRTWLVLVAVISLPLLAGCGGGDEGSEASLSVAEGTEAQPEQQQVTVGAPVAAQSAALFVAIDQGFFDEEGIQVTTQQVLPRATIPSLLGGEIDIAGLDWATVLTAVQRDIPLTAVSEGARGRSGAAEYLAAADSDIQTVEDLAGKKVASLSAGGACQLIAEDALREAGVDQEPEFIELQPLDTAGALERGDVDAVCLPEPLSTLVKEQGGRTVFDIFTGSYDAFPINGYIAKSDYAEQNPGTIGAFQRGMERAAQLIQQNPGIVAEVLPEYTIISPEQAQGMTQLIYPTEIDRAKIDEVVQLMERVGLEIEISEDGAGS